MKKIGFFGGTFDPIHSGHINVGVRILEAGLVDQILYSPARISPTKGEAPPIAPCYHRLNMLQLALEDVPGCDLYDEEIKKEGPSYTIDALKGIKGELRLIVAEDAAYGFDQWKDIEQLLEMAPPIIAIRHGFNREKLNHLPDSIKWNIEKGLIQIPAMDISSTEIRERLKKRLYCGHLLPGKVLDYIHQNTLY
jgi:nicotinate-nucleotide adenylyltransferase